MPSFDLPLARLTPLDGNGKIAVGSLPVEVLTDNVFWFCRLRWMVIALLCVTEILAAGAPSFFARHGIYLSPRWPLACALVLSMTNALFLLHGHRLKRSLEFKPARTNLLFQSASDLLALTAVIHFVGSVETFAPFAYLFHVVLACIFFPSGLSLAVTLVSCLLYSACVTLEHFDVIHSTRIFAGIAVREGFQAEMVPLILHVVSAMAVWMVVWYLVSHLSAVVRRRDQELTAANERLIRIEDEKAMHMLRTTHELKAPFAAIHSNVQLLRKGYCGQISKDVGETLERIDARCLKLSAQITEMLQLADLRSSPPGKTQREDVRLDQLIHSVVESFRVPASAKGIEIQEDLSPAVVRGVMGHLYMMLANLVSNAVAYSREGGRIWVTCTQNNSGSTVVTIKDEGIGIPERSLPRIFDEYYRSSEAADYNKLSTGLGLAIVKHIAQSHQVAVHVESEEGKGTIFRLAFPSPGEKEV